MSPTTGLDLGGTKVLGVVLDDDGAILGEQRTDTPDEGEALVEALARMADELPATPAVGVGAAGMVDRDGVVRYAPNVPGLREFPLRARLEAALGRPVVVENDANAAAWGEAAHGAARGWRDALVITLGTGIGGGIITGGRLYRGGNGFAAEIGHFQLVSNGPMCACGEPGHWEAVASGTALGRLARERAEDGLAQAVLELAGSDPAAVTGEHLSQAALAGDGEALGILAEFADLVALGLAGLANILDPEGVVVGGGLVALGETLLAPVRDGFRRHIEAPDHRPEIAVVAAELGERAGAIGAAALAREIVP